MVPRRASLGEHVDDHQQQLTRKLADWGLVVPVQERISADDAQLAARPPLAPEALRERPSAAEVVRVALR